jgi:hypothetical protein
MDRETFFIITSTIFIILIIITIIFSSVIIVVIIYNWKNQSRTVTNLLLCNSCVALLYHSIATTIEISFLSTTYYWTTNLCKLRAFIYFNSCSTIAYSYLIQSISRYFITILYKHKILLTFHINWILIIFNWIISGILAGCMFISPLAYQYESESRMCLLTSKIFVSSFIGIAIAFCIPFTTVILLYTLILYHTTRNQLNSNIFTALRLRRNLRVFQNILIFVFILGIGGTPYLISVIINRRKNIPWQLYTISVLFISLSATLESVALFFTNIQIKKLFHDMIHCVQRADPSLTMIQHNALIPQINDI